MSYENFKSAYNNLMLIAKKSNKHIQKDIYQLVDNLINEYPRFYEGMLYQLIESN